MRELDRAAIENYGIPGIVLMENAALAFFNLLVKKYPRFMGKKAFIFCGKGNNGGDGFAIARHFSNAGREVEVILLTEPENIKGDAAINFKIIQKMGIPTRTVTRKEELESLRSSLTEKDLIVDAIFGTGLTSAVKGFCKEVIDFINGLSNRVVAVDIPSGLNADTGSMEGSCVHADLTVTFALPKVAHVVTPASNYAGSLEVLPISIPEELIRKTKMNIEVMEKQEIAELLPARFPDTHKGDYGHFVVIGGSTGKGGAPALAALAGLRSGAGLATLAVPGSIHAAIEMDPLEVMSMPLPESENGTITEAGFEEIEAFLKDKNAVVFGPGTETDERTGKFLKKLMKNVSCPVVLDADGLNLLALDMEILENKKVPVLLTPHPGEMARLMSISTKEVQSRRLETALELSRRTDCHVILKGAGSIIATPTGEAYVNTMGNPGMATAGTGDVLSGMIAGFMAQGMEPVNAAKAGVFLHGLAGDRVARELGERSLLAGDILEALPGVFFELMND